LGTILRNKRFTTGEAIAKANAPLSPTKGLGNLDADA
jgi:hypothetical protein